MHSESKSPESIERSSTWKRTLLLGAAAGLFAMGAIAPINRVLDRLVSDDQRRRERRVRKGSPHALAGPTAGEKLLGRKLTQGEMRGARFAFTVTYGIGWGILYALVRSRIPAAGRFAGLPFAVPFYALCDGVIAPALQLSPSVTRVPWQLNAKELANHIAWTASTELVHRSVGRIQR
jgi:hypothetical protein